MPSCYSCNASKHDMALEVWREHLSKLIYQLRNHKSNFRVAERFGLVKELKCGVVFYFEKVK
jgi:hypothetical protein